MRQHGASNAPIPTRPAPKKNTVSPPTAPGGNQWQTITVGFNKLLNGPPTLDHMLVPSARITP